MESEELKFINRWLQSGFEDNDILPPVTLRAKYLLRGENPKKGEPYLFPSTLDFIKIEIDTHCLKPIRSGAEVVRCFSEQEIKDLEAYDVREIKLDYDWFVSEIKRGFGCICVVRNMTFCFYVDHSGFCVNVFNKNRLFLRALSSLYERGGKEGSSTQLMFRDRPYGDEFEMEGFSGSQATWVAASIWLFIACTKEKSQAVLNAGLDKTLNDTALIAAPAISFKPGLRLKASARLNGYADKCIFSNQIGYVKTPKNHFSVLCIAKFLVRENIISKEQEANFIIKAKEYLLHGLRQRHRENSGNQEYQELLILSNGCYFAGRVNILDMFKLFIPSAKYKTESIKRIVALIDDPDSAPDEFNRCFVRLQYSFAHVEHH
jgi:hypothetical protein